MHVIAKCIVFHVIFMKPKYFTYPKGIAVMKKCLILILFFVLQTFSFIVCQWMHLNTVFFRVITLQRQADINESWLYTVTIWIIHIPLNQKLLLLECQDFQSTLKSWLSDSCSGP